MVAEGQENRDRVERGVRALFYTRPADLVDLVDRFAGRVLAGKRPESALLTPYRKFEYAAELAQIDFPYRGRSVDEFLVDFEGHFENVVNFDAPGVLFNVHPNVNLAGQVASLVAAVVNPNFGLDMPSGRLLLLEKAVVGYLSELVGWPVGESGGVFTFGGKGTLLYALKAALARVDPGHRESGVRGGLDLVISTVSGHPSHVEVCNWAGLGQSACLRLPTVAGRIDVGRLWDALIEADDQGRRVPMIIVNGMTTDGHVFDPVDEVVAVRDEFVRLRRPGYRPWVHVDSVIGWVHLITGRYDFGADPLAIGPEVGDRLRTAAAAAAQFGLADSFAADFHKTGFCGYSSSVLVVRRRDDLFRIQGGYTEAPDLEFSEYAPYDYTLESSRSAHGPVAAYATLQTLGVEGFVHILAEQTAAFTALKTWFGELDNAVVCNADVASNVVFVAFLPPRDGDRPPTDPEIGEFNSGIYDYLMHKAALGPIPVYFSVASHAYRGGVVDCLKLYSFNSTLNPRSAREVFDAIVDLVAEYEAFEGDLEPARTFDFQRSGGASGVDHRRDDRVDAGERTPLLSRSMSLLIGVVELASTVLVALSRKGPDQRRAA